MRLCRLDRHTAVQRPVRAATAAPRSARLAARRSAPQRAPRGTAPPSACGSGDGQAQELGKAAAQGTRPEAGHPVQLPVLQQHQNGAHTARGAGNRCGPARARLPLAASPAARPAPPTQVGCSMDWERQLGTVTCIVCHESWMGKINHLSEPIDVYSDWLDACEAANS